MTVAESIYGALARFGRPMVLRRTTLAAGSTKIPLDVTVSGVTENYQPQELTDVIAQGDTKVTISNTEISARQWPGPPRRGDDMVIDGKVKAIQSVETKRLGTETLVHICQVRG